MYLPILKFLLRYCYASRFAYRAASSTVSGPFYTYLFATGFMFLYVLLALMLLGSAWLWHPLRSTGWRYYSLAIALTIAFGISPAVLIWALRNTTVSYTLIAYTQVIAGWLLASIAGAWLLAVLRDLMAALGWGLGMPQAVFNLWQPKTTLVGTSFVLFVCAYGALQGLQAPEVREQELTLASLPPELNGLRVAVLADLHASPVNNVFYIREVVERTNAAKPDLILLPGDLVDGDAQTQAHNIAPLADLKATYGAWAAPGNHEYYSGYLAWAEVFKQLQLPYLANEAETILVKGKRLTISGVGDPAYYQSNHSGDGVEPDIATVVHQAWQQESEFHILLGHQPKVARRYAARSSFDLHIAGHTHGGHILGLDRLIAHFNDGFVRGRYDLDGMTLFVSSGAGLWAGFTQRLGVPAAIDVLVLRSSKKLN